jgi:hypothetical protein
MAKGICMMKIAKVVPNAEHCITVSFDNNHSMILDMKLKLHTARFSGLRSDQVFAAAKTDGKSIHWPGEVSISISEILEIVTK